MLKPGGPAETLSPISRVGGAVAGDALIAVKEARARTDVRKATMLSKKLGDLEPFGSCSIYAIPLH